jgi:hypothetical protein
MTDPRRPLAGDLELWHHKPELPGARIRRILYLGARPAFTSQRVGRPNARLPAFHFQTHRALPFGPRLLHPPSRPCFPEPLPAPRPRALSRQAPLPRHPPPCLSPRWPTRAGHSQVTKCNVLTSVSLPKLTSAGSSLTTNTGNYISVRAFFPPLTVNAVPTRPTWLPPCASRHPS